MAGVRHQSNELELFIESVVTECGANRAIELRLISSGSDGAHAELRKGLISSLQVKGINADGVFPMVDQPMRTDSPPSSGPSYGPDPGMEKLLSISTEHLPASLERPYIASVNSDNGGFFINSWSGTQRFDLQDSTFEEVFESSDGGHEISATRLGDQVYVAMDGELHTCSDGVLTPTEVKAHSVASVGEDDLLIHRKIELSEALGFGGNNPSISQLVLRGSSGEERVIYTFRHQAILGMDVCGRHVLLQLGEGSESDPEIDIVIATLGTDPKFTEAERWSYVTHVRPAPDGWLIAGVPTSGAPGTYLMQLDGTRRRILEDRRVRAIGLSEDQRLYYVVLEVAVVDGGPKLRSVALADLKKAAILRAPWSAIDLGELSRDAQPSEGLPDHGEGAFESWMTFLEKANKLSQERFDCQFPAHPEIVDALINLLAGSADLDEDGRKLLVAVVIRALANEGGVWAVAPSARPVGASPSGFMHPNEVAFGFNASTAVFHVGDEESEVYDVVQRTLSLVEGRQLLIGTDSGTLRQAVAEARTPLAQIAFEKVTVDQLKALTNASPQGFRLRDYLYRRLIQFDRGPVAAELASHHADSEHASYTDVAVAFGSQELTKESASEAIDRLKGAIRRFPRVADFYVLLGEAYEVGRGKDHKEHAYACFAKAESMLYSGSVLDRAEAGMKRTGDS